MFAVMTAELASHLGYNRSTITFILVEIMKHEHFDPTSQSISGIKRVVPYNTKALSDML